MKYAIWITGGVIVNDKHVNTRRKNPGSVCRMPTPNPTLTGSRQTHVTAFSAGTNTGCPSPLTKYILGKPQFVKIAQ